MKNRKSLGQHWLKDRDILLDISDMAATDGCGVVVEIGPGLGTLTSALFKNFEKVVAIELDDRLAENLPKSFPGKNLEVHNQDILSLELESLNLPEKYVVAGNIPSVNVFVHRELNTVAAVACDNHSVVFVGISGERIVLVLVALSLL